MKWNRFCLVILILIFVSPGFAAKKSKRVEAATVEAEDDDFRRWNMQLGVSSGSSNGKSYTEVGLGVGCYFYRWLEWHNALFASFNRVTNIYGLDSSLRGVLNVNLGVAHIHAFAGPGYRLAANLSDLNTAFAEAGMIVSVSGFSLGGGVRQFFYSMKDSRLANENQYFIILSGSASF